VACAKARKVMYSVNLTAFKSLSKNRALKHHKHFLYYSYPDSIAYITEFADIRTKSLLGSLSLSRKV
jgi:hypothetical protein